jgi:hypothetical protein
MTPGWGMLPDHAVQLIKKWEWDHWAHLKARLSGEKKFPIRLGLKPPDGKKAVADMAHYLAFVNAWKAFPFQEMVRWEPRNFQTLPDQTIPAALVISSIRDLAELMGKKGEARVGLWENKMRPILEVGSALPPPNPLYPVLVRRLDLIEKLSSADTRMLADLLPQLTPGMGEGLYLRALPVTGVDTKFIEIHKLIIEELLDVLHGGAVTGSGGLLPWLDCMPRPAGWLMIRPLDKSTRNALGGLSILKLPYMTLLTYELPAEHILVVENIEPGLALPPMEDTIAVIGGGKNVAWMDAVWLKEKYVGYWGDIDTWGLCFLSDARSKVKHLSALMMDKETLLAHQARMSVEPQPAPSLPQYLTEDEIALFQDLNSGTFQSNRLEQERICADYIRSALNRWHIS